MKENYSKMKKDYNGVLHAALEMFAIGISFLVLATGLFTWGYVRGVNEGSGVRVLPSIEPAIQKSFPPRYFEPREKRFPQEEKKRELRRGLC
ncbi:MAG: hypothetical protein KKF68_00250 [Nanoarchaeota archaeon]|nr:hypothetical protein [Nanoarchaeota archaeon]